MLIKYKKDSGRIGNLKSDAEPLLLCKYKFIIYFQSQKHNSIPQYFNSVLINGKKKKIQGNFTITLLQLLLAKKVQQQGEILGGGGVGVGGRKEEGFGIDFAHTE